MLRAKEDPEHSASRIEALEQTVKNLTGMLKKAQMLLEVAGQTDAIQHMNGVIAALEGTPYEQIPASSKSEAVAAICKLKVDYDELWQSMERLSAAPPAAIVATTQVSSPVDLERYVVEHDFDYVTGRALLMLDEANGVSGMDRVDYIRAAIELLKEKVQ